MTNLSELLKNARKRLNKTQGEIAQECGWVTEKEAKDSNSRVANYESGYRTPRVDHIPLLAHALNLSPVSIFNSILEEQGRSDLILTAKSGDQAYIEIKNSSDFLEQFGRQIQELPKIEQIKLAGKIEMIVEEYMNKEG